MAFPPDPHLSVGSGGPQDSLLPVETEMTQICSSSTTHSILLLAHVDMFCVPSFSLLYCILKRSLVKLHISLDAISLTLFVFDDWMYGDVCVFD